MAVCDWVCLNKVKTVNRHVCHVSRIVSEAAAAPVNSNRRFYFCAKSIFTGFSRK